MSPGLRGLSRRAGAPLAAHPPGGTARGQAASTCRTPCGHGSASRTASSSRRRRAVRRGGPAARSDPREGSPRMNMDTFTQTSGEWLRGNGPESDIVISSRIRLARNLSAFPFANRASAHQKTEIEAALRDRIAKLDFSPQLDYFQLPSLTPLDRQLLVERQLISRELANAEGPRG